MPHSMAITPSILVVGGGNPDLINQDLIKSGYVTVTGALGHNSTMPTIITDYIPVTVGTEYNLHTSVTVPASNYGWRGWAFYDADQNMIGNRFEGKSGAVDTDTLTITDDDMIAPIGAVYVRCSCRVFDDGQMSLTIKQNN